MIKLSWSDFKTFITSRNVPLHETTVNGRYFLEAFDGPISRTCLITDTADITDYENNYQAAANPGLSDSNGVALSRAKITQSGWHYQCHSVEFTSSKLNSGYCSDDTGADLGFVTIKYYDTNDTELVAGTQAELDNNCVKTVIDWEPTYDVEIIGGNLFQATAPSTDVRLWVTAVPDIPVIYGGSVPFCQGGLNLKYLGTGDVYKIDGKTPKLMAYSATYHTNKFRITLLHGTGVQAACLMVFQLFRANA